MVSIPFMFAFTYPQLSVNLLSALLSTQEFEMSFLPLPDI